MPLLSIETNVNCSDEQITKLTANASKLVAEMLAKPERYVMVKFQYNKHMRFDGNENLLAYVELKSINLTEQQTASYSGILCEFLSQMLNIEVDRIYIEFANAQRHLWGWNNATF